MQKAAERVLQTTSTTTRPTTPWYQKSVTSYTIGQITVMTATEASLQTKENSVAQYMPPPVFAPLTTATSTTTTATTTTTTTTMATTTVAPSKTKTILKFISSDLSEHFDFRILRGATASVSGSVYKGGNF